MKLLFTGNSLLASFIISATLLAPQVMASKVYKWVDENGITHFSEHPPRNTPTTLIKPKTGHSEPVFYGSSSAAASEESTEGMVTQEEYHRERCDIAKKNIEALRNFGRVKVRNDEGELHYLTEDEQQQRLQTNQQMVDESC